jgi:hypothetical protein
MHWHINVVPIPVTIQVPPLAHCDTEHAFVSNKNSYSFITEMKFVKIEIFITYLTIRSWIILSTDTCVTITDRLTSTSILTRIINTCVNYFFFNYLLIIFYVKTVLNFYFILLQFWQFVPEKPTRHVQM